MLPKVGSFKVLVVKASGRIKMAFAIGERLELLNTFLRLRDLKDSGRILKKNADFREYTFSLMKKTLDSLSEDLNKLTLIEYALIL